MATEETRTILPNKLIILFEKMIMLLKEVLLYLKPTLFFNSSLHFMTLHNLYSFSVAHVNQQ